MCLHNAIFRYMTSEITILCKLIVDITSWPKLTSFPRFYSYLPFCEAYPTE